MNVSEISPQQYPKPTYEVVPIDWLKPAKRNARTHDEAQIALLVNGIGKFEVMVPIVVDSGYRIAAGHGRWEAAKRLGLTHVPVMRVEHLSEDQLRLYAIADNRTAERAGWDEDVLAVEFQELEIALPEISLSISGFDLPKIDLLTASLSQTNWSDLDEVPETPADRRAVTMLGDTWLFGDTHRLTCDDSTDAAVVDALLDGEPVDLVATDPPYNRHEREYSGKGRHKHGDFQMAAGELSREGFTSFLGNSFAAVLPHVRPGCLLYVFMDAKHIRELLGAGDANQLALLNVCIWDKGKGGMGGLYRNAYEMIFVFKHGDVPHKNRVELGRHGRNRTTLWRYEGFNSFSKARDRALSMHATMKPIQMICDLILDASDRDDVIYDGFGGSGSTLIAAQKLGRRARIVELDPRYCDTIIERYLTVFGSEPMHSELGVPYSEVRARRLSDAEGAR